MPRALKILIPATISLALLCLALGDWGFAPAFESRFRDALVAFGLLSLLSEASYVKLRIGSASTNSSIVFIPFIASIQLFSSGWAMLIACLVVGLAEQLVRHKPPEKVFYNVSQHGISVWAGAMVFKLLGGVPAFSAVVSGSEAGSLSFSVPWLPTVGSIVTYFIVNISAVSLAVSLSQGFPLQEVWLRIGGSSLLNDLASSPLGVLLAFLYVKLGMLGVLILILPLYFVRHTYYVNVQLEEANRELLELMVKNIEARDPYTSGHSQRVSRLAELLAREIGLGSKMVEHIRTAALLHDVGKIYEEYAQLLRKDGKLDSTEKALMQTHAARSADLVSTISAFRGPIVDAVRHHHENFDGTGYPQGLAGKAIPIGARIIMIADTVDAMTTDRPYRKALGFERVASELDRFAGKQFDPELIRLFLQSSPIREFVSQRAASTSTESVSPPPMPVGTWRRVSERVNPMRA